MSKSKRRKSNKISKSDASVGVSREKIEALDRVLIRARRAAVEGHLRRANVAAFRHFHDDEAEASPHRQKGKENPRVFLTSRL